MKARSDWTWNDVPYSVLSDIQVRLNSLLILEEIPEVRYDVFSWRIARAMQNCTSGEWAAPQLAKGLNILISNSCEARRNALAEADYRGWVCKHRRKRSGYC